MVGNLTSHLTVVEKQVTDVDKRTTAICCMVTQFEDELRRMFGKRCPTEMVIVTRLYHGVLEDVLDIICRKPTCVDVFRGYRIPKPGDYRGIVSIILRIVFSISD